MDEKQLAALFDIGVAIRELGGSVNRVVNYLSEVNKELALIRNELERANQRIEEIRF